MKTITFPRTEWPDIQKRFSDKHDVITMRVALEFGKFDVGDLLETEWGVTVKVVNKEIITGGVEGLRTGYKYFSQLTDEMIKSLGSYSDVEVITLRSV